MSTCPDCEAPDCLKSKGTIHAIRCDVRTIALLRQKLAASERELQRWGYVAKLLAYYDEGQTIEICVGENGDRRIETPEHFAFGDHIGDAAEVVCKSLGLLDKEGG